MLRVNVVDVRSSVRVTNVVTGKRDAVVVRGTSGSPMWWIAILVRARPTNELDVGGGKSGTETRLLVVRVFIGKSVDRRHLDLMFSP